MDPSPSGGGRRKKRGGRSGGGRSNNNNNNNGGGGNKSRRKRKRGRGGNPMSRATLDRLPPAATKDDSSILGGRVLTSDAKERPLPFSSDPDGFGLFCAYYLGVTPDDGYQKPSLEATARRYGISREEVRSLLAEFKLDPETFKGSSFDLEGARLDVRLAPEGISRIEIARDQYAEYLSIIED